MKTPMQQETIHKARRNRSDVWPVHMARERSLVRPQMEAAVRMYLGCTTSKVRQTMFMYLLRAHAEGVIAFNGSSFRVLDAPAFTSHVLGLFAADSVDNKTVRWRFSSTLEFVPARRGLRKWHDAFAGRCDFIKKE